jgi:hypothetical protein
VVTHTTEVAEGIHRLTNGVANFYLIADTPQALASPGSLDGIKAGLLLPGHGDPWTGGVEDAIRRARAAGPS